MVRSRQTNVVHAGYIDAQSSESLDKEPIKAKSTWGGAVAPPVVLSTTFRAVEGEAGFISGAHSYSRVSNPNREWLEQAVASLEGAKHAAAFASGVAATFAIVSTLPRGASILADESLYGGTYRILDEYASKQGIAVHFVDVDDSEAMAQALAQKPTMVWIESPTNPCLRIRNIAAIARDAHAAGSLLVVDNTFATPYLQRPLDLGADIVLHSTSKYLNGHSDVIGGAVATSHQATAEQCRYQQKSLGAVPSPFDCFLTQRGITTLSVRMDRHCANALAVAQYLQEHAKVTQVHYPGLPSHPGHLVAKEQMRGFGGVVSVVLSDQVSIPEFFRKIPLFTVAESLGGVESLVAHPATMSHASMPQEMRLRLGIDDRLVRLSVGIEGEEDLRASLRDALS